MRDLTHRRRQRRLERLLDKAQSSLEDTDEEAALKQLEEASRFLDASSDAHLTARFIDMMSRFDMDEARSAYVEAARAGALDDSLSIGWVRILVSEGSYDEARDILYSLSPGPFEAERHILLGMSWMGTGDMSQAARSFQESARWDSQLDAPYQLMEQMDPQGNWGVVHQIERFDYQDAEASRDLFFDEVSGRGPVVRLAKALHLWHSDSPEAALAAWRPIRSRNADNLLVLKVGARMTLHTGRLDQAIERYEEALRLDPENVGLLQEYGDALIGMGDAGRALPVLDRALALSPENRKAMLSKVRAYSASGDRKGCSDVVRELADSPHWDGESQPVAIEMLIDCGAHREAERRLSELMREHPLDLRFMRLSIRNHTLSGSYDEAVRVADKVIKVSGEGFSDHMVKAGIQFQMGDHKGARRTLSNILRLEPHHLPALTLLKDVSRKEGDDVAVMELCDQILYLDPDDIGAMKDKAASLDRTGASVEAMEMYCRVLQSPGGGPSHLKDILATVLSGSHPEDAAEISDRFLDMHGKDWQLWVLRGNSLYGSGRMEDAAKAFAEASALNGNDSQVWLSRAMALEQSGQLQDALDCYDKAIVRDLGSPEAWMGKAIVLERMGDLKESLRNLEQVLKSNPGHRNALIRKARLLVRMGKLQEAVYFLDMAIKLDRRDLTPLVLRKEVMKQMQDHNGVVLSADEILRQREDDQATLMDKARALQGLHQDGEALKVLARLQRLRPEDTAVMALRKRSLEELDRGQEAMAVLEEMIAVRPDDKALLLELLGSRMGSGDRDGSLQALDRLLELEPLHPGANLAKAELLMGAGFHVEALGLLARLREEGIWDSGSMSLLAQAQLASGDALSSLSTAEEGLVDNPALEGLHTSRSRALLALGKPAEALQASEEGLRVSPQSPSLWRSRADAFMASGDSVAALNAYDRAVGFGDVDPDTHYNRALAQRALDKPEMAMSSLRRALDYRPGHAAAWSLLGQLQAELGLLREARRSLDASLELSPDDRVTLLRRARLHVSSGEPLRAVELLDQMGEMGLADAPMLTEKAELLMTMGDKPRALEALREAHLMDPFQPGLEGRLQEVESSLHGELLLRAAHDILDSNHRDGAPLDAEYVRSRSEERFHAELEAMLLSQDGLKPPAVWSPEFESLEAQSRQMLLSLGRRDGRALEEVTLAQVYMRMAEPDIRRAKEIHAHIRSSLGEELPDCEIMSTRVHAAREAIAGKEEPPSLSEVMRRYDMGPYAARLVLGASRCRDQ